MCGDIQSYACAQFSSIARGSQPMKGAYWKLKVPQGKQEARLSDLGLLSHQEGVPWSLDFSSDLCPSESFPVSMRGAYLIHRLLSAGVFILIHFLSPSCLLPRVRSPIDSLNSYKGSIGWCPGCRALSLLCLPLLHQLVPLSHVHILQCLRGGENGLHRVVL